MIHLIAYSQQGKNIDLKEVVNVASEIPKITIDSHDYSMRNRDEVLTEILRSTFWNENFKFLIELQDFYSDRKYSYQSKGRVRIFINNIELTKRHLFKTFKSIRRVLFNIESVEITSDFENRLKINYLGNDESSNLGTYKREENEVPFTRITIQSSIRPDRMYNRMSKKRKALAKISFNQSKSIALKEVEVVTKEEDGMVYAPEQVNGQIVFQKNSGLTKFARSSDRYKRMGLNAWGIDVNTDNWTQALRVFLRGKQMGTTSEGFPLLYAGVAGNQKSSPLWVIDGVYLTDPPQSPRSLTPVIREVKILKYSETSLYGSRGQNGVIVINTVSSQERDALNYKQSFAVKGKKNRELMIVFKSYEKKFIQKLDALQIELERNIEINNVEKVDSIQILMDKTLFRSYLFTAHYAIQNADHEIAPYLCLSKISDMNLSILDLVESKLSPKVKSSRYGKKFKALLKSRRYIEK